MKLKGKEAQPERKKEKKETKERNKRKKQKNNQPSNQPRRNTMKRITVLFVLLAMSLFAAAAFAGGGGEVSSMELIPAKDGMLSSTDVGVTTDGKLYIREGLVSELGFGDPEGRGMFPASKGSWENPIECKSFSGYFVCDTGRKFSPNSLATFNFTLGGSNTWTGDQVTFFGFAEMKSPDFKGFVKGYYASVDNTVGGGNHVGYPVKFPWEK